MFRVAIGASAATSQAGIWTDWPRAALFVWLAGSFVFVLRWFIGWSIVAGKSRRFVRIDDAGWNADLESAAGLLGMPGIRVTLREGKITSPAASGVFSHSILLPEDARNWDPFRRRTVLLHEVAHIRRRDCLWQQIAALACALFWFHPLVWRVAARLAREQELACDDLALSAGINRRAYAALLLHAAQEISSGDLFACAFRGQCRATHLRARFANILEAPGNRRVSRHGRKVFATALACFLLTLSSVTLARAEHIYRIGKGVSAPTLITKVEPQYTAAAKAAKIEGTVLLSVIIGKDGRGRHI
ncbi:MAG: M56 family metallopeptidase, partial [Bryobacteraceae bacterium]